MVNDACAYPRDVCSTLKELWVTLLKNHHSLFAGIGLGGRCPCCGRWLSSGKSTESHQRPVAALQNGAKLFTNYRSPELSLGCVHALQPHARHWPHRKTDQGKPDVHHRQGGRSHEAAIDPKQAKDWFGANPPDLTLVARSRAGGGGTGAVVVTYSLPTTVINQANWLEQYGVPQRWYAPCLWELQGERKPIFETVTEHGHEVQRLKGWEQVLLAACPLLNTTMQWVIWFHLCNGWLNQCKMPVFSWVSGSWSSWVSLP